MRLVSTQDAELSRRAFLKSLGAGLVAASASACAGPAGEIVPYVTQPPEITPGIAQHYATAMELDGCATGLIVEAREGRPVKVEGNPAHPASLGAAGVFEQASIYQLYDPDRPTYVRLRAAMRSWTDCAAAFSEVELRRRCGDTGAGLYLLLEPTGSPVVGHLLDQVRARFPDVHVHFYAPLVTGFAEAGSALATGTRAVPILALDRADVIASFDANVLGDEAFHLRYARQFADRRRVRTPADSMNRLYVAEGAFTPTGIAADHRLSVRPGDVPALMAMVLARVTRDLPGSAPESLSAALSRHDLPDASAWCDALASDLVAHRGRAAVAAGRCQPPVSHALAVAMNAAVGADAVTYVPPPLLQGETLDTLIEAMQQGRVDALVVIGGNPSYNTPADARFGALARQVPLTLYAGEYENETAADTAWFVPLAHFLESWSDTRALDGTVSIVQPLIAPLHGAQSVVELLGFLAADRRPAYEIVRRFWIDERFGGDEQQWIAALRTGVVPGTASLPVAVTVDWPALESALERWQPQASALHVAFTADASVHDGRFANNPWLQELPDPVTKLTWDNAAFMSGSTLAAIGGTHAQQLDLAAGSRRVQAPAFAVPGIADGLIVLPLGYGRRGEETTAAGVGVDAFQLLPRGAWTAGVSATPVVALGALRPVHEFAVTSAHWSLEGRPIVLESTLDRFRNDRHFTAEHKGAVVSWYTPEYPTSPQWAMAIDLTVCTGCSACMVACQAENNVPVVGKAGVQQRREMHWLRIDRYLQGDARSPQLAVQPMLCQHCEKAPCEYVCPVNATVHSDDGLNEMVYNRCVGTRFCSNNCPYKVRRFNFLNYTQLLPETEQMAMNPDVTVRARGVMEKCSFCVQRIRRAGIDAQLEGSERAVRELQTACQQACPTRAIVFGSIADQESEVAATARADQSYHVLNELGTRPRVWYLARLRNPNTALESAT